MKLGINLDTAFLNAKNMLESLINKGLSKKMKLHKICEKSQRASSNCDLSVT